MLKLTYTRVVNPANSKYFNVVSHPTMVYNKILADDECGYAIFLKYLEMKRKLWRNFFSLTRISGISPILRNFNFVTIYHLTNFLWWRKLTKWILAS